MDRIVIYARVSTNKQDFERQVQDLKNYAEKCQYVIVDIIAETISGSKELSDREGLKKVMELAKDNQFDKLLVSEVSRLGRKTSEVIRVIEIMTELKISIYIQNYGVQTLDDLKRPNPVASLIFALLAETAKLEKETLLQRISSGIADARRKGVKLGRPKKTSKPDKVFINEYKKVFNYLDKGLTIRAIAKICECSTSTVMKARKINNMRMVA